MGAGIINIVGNFGTVFCDQSYWQSAIAANPASAHKGYLLGGIVWFTIPFALATALGALSLGLAYNGRLLCDSVQRHAYYYEHIPSPSLHALDWICARAGLAAQALDLGITPDEAGAGLVPPAVAIAYMGNFGGILILTMLFMARTTPTCSSSLAVGLAPNTPVGSLKHWVQDHAMRMAWACDR